MSNISPKLAMVRIAEAPMSSPIGVFRSDKGGCVDAIFADTVRGRRRVNSGDGLVGIFDKTSAAKAVFAILKNAEAPYPHRR